MTLHVTLLAVKVALVQSRSRSQPFATPRNAARQPSLSFSVSWSLLKFTSVESVTMPSNHLILCCPLLLLPSIFPSIRIFSSKLAHHIRWPKYWSFSFSISPSSENAGLISFRIDLLAVQGTLKGLLQNSLKAVGGARTNDSTTIPTFFQPPRDHGQVLAATQEFTSPVFLALHQLYLLFF